MLVMKCLRLLRFGSRPSVKLLKAVIGICSPIVCQFLWLPLSGSQCQCGSHYFFSAGADAGRSEFQISATTFHVPSTCFLKISTYLPRSLTGLPLASVIVSS